MSVMPSSLPGSPSPLVRAQFRTPRAAAIAGILFSVLLIVSMWLLRVSIPSDPLEAGAWLKTSSRRVSLALNLIPFAGIAFMWFIGVLRDRLGTMEDRFFATVFLGSGLMFLGMLFVAATLVGSLVRVYAVSPDELFVGATFPFARAFTYDLMHIYAFKMAGVFMISTSTIAVRTRFIPRWIALLGYALAVLLLLGSNYLSWALFVFPGWVLLVSIPILLDDVYGTARPSSPAG